MTKITDIPVKVLINTILPLCEAKDLFSLSCTNKFFAHALTGENFWRQKVAIEYGFTGPETNSRYGWKLIYQRLGKPQNFWWGYVVFSSYYLRSYTFVGYSLT